jgi:hypothetical protein
MATPCPLSGTYKIGLNVCLAGALLTGSLGVRNPMAILPFLASIRNAKMLDVQQPIFDAPRAPS